MRKRVKSLSGNVAQVTTAVDDSVVYSDHLWPARRSHRWHWLSAAAGSLVVATAAFAKGLSSAAADHTARSAWIAAGNPLGDFRPGTLSLTYDIVAASALLLALFFGIGALVRWRQRPSTYNLDSDADRTIHATNRGPYLSPTILAQTTFYTGGVEVRGCDGVISGAASHGVDGGVVLAAETTAVIEHGIGRTIVRSVPAPRTGAAAASWLQIEGRTVQIFGASAIAHALLLVLLTSIPPAAATLSLDHDFALARISQIRDVSFSDPMLERHSGSTTGSSDASTEQAEMSPPDGVTGNPTQRQTSGRYEIKRRTETPQLAREAVLAAARRGGVLGTLSSSDPFANMVGVADFSSRFGASDYRGGIDGMAGEIAGSWGQWGIDGGIGKGPGYGTVASGGYGGTCDMIDCKGLGGSGLRLGGRGDGPTGIGRRSPVQATVGKAVVVGGLDRELIRRYVRQKLPRIRHCYEARLLESNELSGTVTAKWIINTQGGVLGARASGSGDGPLDNCVRRAIESIQFPRAEQLVNVTYPFTFHRAG